MICKSMLSMLLCAYVVKKIRRGTNLLRYQFFKKKKTDILCKEFHFKNEAEPLTWFRFLQIRSIKKTIPNFTKKQDFLYKIFETYF